MTQANWSSFFLSTSTSEIPLWKPEIFRYSISFSLYSVLIAIEVSQALKIRKKKSLTEGCESILNKWFKTSLATSFRIV